MRNVFTYFMLFFIYAILGWIIETTLVSIEKRKFVNRSIHKKSEKGHSVIRESSHRVCLPCKRPGGGKAWYIYETGRHKTGQTAEAGIRTVCQIGAPHPQSVGTDGKSVSDRRDHLLYRAGNPELYRQCAGNGSPDGR